MSDFEQALVKALNRCRRDQVKPVASNIQTRLDGRFAFYSYASVKLKLHQMHQRGLLTKPENKPRGGYVVNINRHDPDICPYCLRPMEQMELPLAFAN
jgi:hypothetical protein